MLVGLSVPDKDRFRQPFMGAIRAVIKRLQISRVCIVGGETSIEVLSTNQCLGAFSTRRGESHTLY